MIAALVIFTVLNSAKGNVVRENPEGKKIKQVTLQQAEKIPGLITAMYRQINSAELLTSHSRIYVATVTFQGTTFLISGTLDQWVRFFKREGLPPVNKQRPANVL